MTDLAIKIIASATGCNEMRAKEIAGEIAAAGTIVESVRACDAAILALEKEFAEKRAAVEARRTHVQDGCAHAATSQMVGSGNNDNWTRCDACGKDLGR